VSHSDVSALRYEFKPFKYSSHDTILKLLEGEREPVKILDVGTANGYLGKILKKKGHYIAGIEKDPAAAEKAKAYYDWFRLADIETFEFPFRREFDYILFADVLEHMRDPAAVLRRCLPALKESGKIIISVPNIANFVIRLSLLAGRFDYTGRGILDRTHLRFFTLRNLHEMAAEGLCEIQDVVPTPLPVQIVLPATESKLFAPLHELLYLLTRSWKTLFAYQFVVVAAPNELGIDFEGDREIAGERILANI
jgi:2-polyprenyl-3-methyl-5-hydroxy-6-metoxy-1,4-benzoquinol methylase